MPLPAILTGLGSVASAGLSYFGNKDARKQIQRDTNSANNYLYETGNTAQDNIDWGYDAARPLFRDRFDYSTGVTAPWQQVGQQGRNALMGLDPNISANATNRNPNISADVMNRNSQFNRSPNITVQRPDELESLRSGDMSDFYESPDYQFRLKEGLDAVQNSAAGQGTLYSGNTLRGVTDYASDLASQEYGNYFNRQKALGDDEYARRFTEQTGNYNRAADQFAGNFARGYGMDVDNRNFQYGVNADNFDRGYGQDVDNRNFLYGVGADNFQRGSSLANNMANIGLAADESNINAGNAYYGDLANSYLGQGGARADLWRGVGQDVANSFLGSTGAMADTRLGGYAGVNNAIQSGIGNYLYGRGAGMWGGGGNSTSPWAQRAVNAGVS